MATPIPIECLEGAILGCTYSNATNYNPSADTDDGSCIFPTVTSNSFEVNIFTSHHMNCTSDKIRTAFFLHIPKITPSTPVSKFHMFISLYCFNYQYSVQLLGSDVQIVCTTPSDSYQNINLFTIGDKNRLANERKQILCFDNLNPNYSNIFSAVETDTDINYSDVKIPIDITIYADGFKYTASTELIVSEALNQINDQFTITVN